LGQNKSNSFEIHLKNSQSSLFIRARPTSLFLRVGPRVSRASVFAPPPPSPTAGRVPHVNVALPHPPAHSRCPPGPTVARSHSSAARAALHCHVATPPPTPAARGSMPATRGIPHHARAPSFFPVPALHVAPTPGPPLPPSFPLCRAPKRIQKPLAAIPFPFSAPLLLARAEACRRLPRPPLTRSTCLGRQDRRSPPRIPPSRGHRSSAR
jgi:hypothetical protein